MSHPNFLKSLCLLIFIDQLRLGFCHYKITNSVWKTFYFFSPRSVFCFGVFGVCVFFVWRGERHASVFNLLNTAPDKKYKNAKNTKTKNTPSLIFFKNRFPDNKTQRDNAYVLLIIINLLLLKSRALFAR